MRTAAEPGDCLLEASGNWGDYRVIEADPKLSEVSGFVYRPWSPSAPWGFGEEPEGDVLDIDDEDLTYCGYFNCHFGHLLVDTISQLWFLRRFRKSRLLFHSSEPPASWFSRDYVKELMSALEISLDDVVMFDHPVRLRRATIASTSMKEQSYIHRVFGEHCRDIGSKIGIPSRPPASGDLTYFSRSRLTVGTAKIVNESDLENALARFGVKVIYPETLSIEEQIAAMYDARCAIGITGSALHLSAYCGSKAVVGVSAGELVNSNFRMIDTVSNNRATYCYPREITCVETPINFHAAWHIADPDRMAESLRSLAEATYAAPSQNER